MKIKASKNFNINIFSIVLSSFIFIVPAIINAAAIKYETISLTRRADNDIVGGKNYMIMSRLSKKYITVGDNNNIHQWEKLQNTSSQVWRFESVGIGIFAILTPSGNLALTVQDGNDKNGNRIILSQYQNTAAQHFILNKDADAYYITAECSGNAALDIYDQSSANGAIIDQWSYWGGDNQKFYITPVEGGATPPLAPAPVPVGNTNPNVVTGTNNNSPNNLPNNLPPANNNAPAASAAPYPNPTPNDKAFLFAFFQGNAPEKEQLSYGLSTDGYNFKILNNGNSIWKSNVGTGCIRDPFIIKGQEGYYYLLATDMRSYSGWDSNRDIVTAKSSDLIHWTDVTSIPICNKYPIFQGADRAWAPQAIYDHEKQSYMIYFAVRVPSNGNKTIMYHAYSKDMKKLDTTPALLFAPKNGNEAIDSDIIFQNNKYYMYYKDETRKTINLAIADHASGPYQEIKQLSDNGIEVEGCNIYPVVGTNKWLMMSDAYVNGYFVLQESTDLVNFRTLDRKTYSFNFTPRHGYVIPISTAQYNDLLKAYPSNGLTPLPVNNAVNTSNTVNANANQPQPIPMNNNNNNFNNNFNFNFNNLFPMNNGKRFMVTKTIKINPKPTNTNSVKTNHPYCQTTTNVVFTDTLKWGVENNKWCILRE